MVGHRCHVLICHHAARRADDVRPQTTRHKHADGADAELPRVLSRDVAVTHLVVTSRESSERGAKKGNVTYLGRPMKRPKDPHMEPNHCPLLVVNASLSVSLTEVMVTTAQ